MYEMVSPHDNVTASLLDVPDLLNDRAFDGLENLHDSRSQVSLESTVASELCKTAQAVDRNLLGQFRGGWRTGVTAGMITAFFVMLINSAVLCWINGRPGISDGVVLAFEGSCEEMAKISTWSHLAINVLSTLLLGANNMGMQCLSSPTRAEVDRSHAQGSWLTIGAPNVGNLGSISLLRSILWILLGLSSIPLHFLYNSVLFSSRSTTNYVAVLVAENFITDGYWNQTRFQIDMTGSNNSTTITGADLQLIESLQQNADTLHRLENTDCINAYSNQISSDWHNVLLVSNVTSLDTVYNMFAYNFSPSSSPWTWLCNSNDTINDYDVGCAANLSKLPETWQFFESRCPSFQHVSFDFNTDYTNLYNDTQDFCSEPIQHSVLHIDHCMARSAIGHCRIEINRIVLIVVLICNTIKVLCLLSTLLIVDFLPLVTVGDAIASFLTIPDQTTVGDGTISARDVVYKQEDELRCRPNTSQYSEIYRWHSPSKVWRPGQPEWSSGTSPPRFFATIFLSMLFWLAVGAGLIYLALDSSTGGSSSVWTAGFGAISIDSLIKITVGMSLTGTILVVNTPQMLLSINYFLYNSLFTSMLLAAETNSYATQSKGLRVSDPRGAQRSTYYLQLPYRYAIPLMIAFGALHWSFSQSVFFVHINIFDINEQPLSTVQACGWSAPALATALVLGYLISLALWAMGKRKYHSGMPIMNSCSLAISAACHSPPGDDDTALKKVMYGATWRSADGTEYAGFSSQDVRSLKAGIRYGREIKHEDIAATTAVRTGEVSVSLYTRAEMSMPLDTSRGYQISSIAVTRR